MSIERHEQVVAQCPNCNKQDFIEKDDNKWFCLNCGYVKDLSEKTTGPGLGGFLVTVWLVVLVIFALLSGA
jgi:ribosomal protein S27AE